MKLVFILQRPCRRFFRLKEQLVLAFTVQGKRKESIRLPPSFGTKFLVARVFEHRRRSKFIIISSRLINQSEEAVEDRECSPVPA